MPNFIVKMVFIRTKKIKNGEYAYIVENSWKKREGKVKQKTKKYLGKVYRFDRVNMMDFAEFYKIDDIFDYVKNADTEKILNDLIKLELFNYGFKESNKSIWEMKGCYFDPKNNRIFNEKKKPIAIAMNEGFLTSHAIRKILNFRAEVEEEGYDLAKMFVEAGISIPKEVFVGFFKKKING